MPRLRPETGGRPWSHGNPIRQSFERREAQIEDEWAASGRPAPAHAAGWLPSIALHDMLTDHAAASPPAPDDNEPDAIPY